MTHCQQANNNITVLISVYQIVVAQSVKKLLTFYGNGNFIEFYLVATVAYHI